MAASLAPLQGQLNQMQGQLNNVQARQLNSGASNRLDPLHGISNAAGIAFAQFPNNPRELDAMTGIQMTAFLKHYTLPTGGTSQAKRRRIKQFIGMRIA